MESPVLAQIHCCSTLLRESLNYEAYHSLQWELLQIWRTTQSKQVDVTQITNSLTCFLINRGPILEPVLSRFPQILVQSSEPAQGREVHANSAAEWLHISGNSRRAPNEHLSATATYMLKFTSNSVINHYFVTEIYQALSYFISYLVGGWCAFWPLAAELWRKLLCSLSRETDHWRFTTGAHMQQNTSHMKDDTCCCCCLHQNIQKWNRNNSNNNRKWKQLVFVHNDQNM